MKKRGISLIVLIITIIVVIILAAVVILTISKNNPIESAKEARFKEDLRNVQDQVEMYIASRYQKELNDFNKNELSISGEKLVSDFGMPVKYKDKIEVEEGKVTYTEDNEKEIKWAKDLNIEINKKRESKVIGEICTTSTNHTDARVKVISYIDNTEKEISHSTARISTEKFTDFNVYYYGSEWHIKSENDYLVFSTTNTTDYTNFISSNDISWSYTENVRYYIISVDGPEYYKITYEMNGGTTRMPPFYNSNYEIDLPIPVRGEDNFLGWTGSNSDIPQPIVKIPKYSKGDKHFVANFDHPCDFDVCTVSTSGAKAILDIIEFNPYFVNEINHHEAMNTVKEFTNFSISYGNLKWTLSALSDNVYYATSRDTPISEYQKLDSLSWSYTTGVHYYIIIK